MFSISLTPEEQITAGTLFYLWPNHPRDWTKDVESQQMGLFNSLVNRNAIPEHRRNWFHEPSFFIGGRGKSRKQLFEKNGTVGKEILRHPHFYRYLHYFIFGPNLPEGLMAGYERFVHQLMKPLTSGDVEPLRKEIRRLMRSYDLDRSSSEEIYKLALELDLGRWNAESVYRAAGDVR